MMLAFTVTGLPAMLFILVFVVLVVLGIMNVVRGGAKGAGKIMNKKGGGGTGAGGI
ncbi:MAG TPA: hypothetical protein VN238_16340 [Solirubrobacteraceae bacterium]|nr:hypothetical protein [Solirubrobacteraceae bacterium]